MTFDIKGLIAVLVIIGSFGLIGIYVYRGEVPDATIVAFVSLPLGAVIGFYFGHINGAATALAQQTTTLAAQAIAAASTRRTTDVGPAPVPPAGSAVLVIPPAAAPAAPPTLGNPG